MGRSANADKWNEDDENRRDDSLIRLQIPLHEPATQVMALTCPVGGRSSRLLLEVWLTVGGAGVAHAGCPLAALRVKPFSCMKYSRPVTGGAAPAAAAPEPPRWRVAKTPVLAACSAGWPPPPLSHPAGGGNLVGSGDRATAALARPLCAASGGTLADLPGLSLNICWGSAGTDSVSPRVAASAAGAACSGGRCLLPHTGAAGAASWRRMASGGRQGRGEPSTAPNHCLTACGSCSTE